MTDNADTTKSSGSRVGSGRWLIRRVLYPALAIAAIVAVIWWLENRDDDATSSSGQEFGVRDLPAEMIPAGASVSPQVGDLAPNFELESLDGDEVFLSDFRGQPVVLNFWAKWCRPCRAEMPQLVAAHDKYRDEGLVIIGLNLQEGRSVIEPFVEEFGVDFTVLLDRDGDVENEYRLLGLPETFFIDRDGVIRSIYRGSFEEEIQDTDVQSAINQTELEERIEEILGDGDG